VVAVAVVLAVGAALTSGLAGAGTGEQEESSSETTVPVSTAAIARGDLVSEDEFTGQVGYGDPWTLPVDAGGIVTAGHELGTVVDFGETLVTIDERPLTLAEGEVPMYRRLALTSPRTTGADVEQLQRFLLGEGFDDEGRLTVDGEFGRATERAVEDWQESLGLDETGSVDASEVVFSPVPLRIDEHVRKGVAFERLQVTEADPVTTVDTSGRDRAALPVGNEVTVELAGGSTIDGVITDQSRHLGDDGNAVWRTTIHLESTPPGDESTVSVTSTVTVADDVLYVPVGALLALGEGGFAVELVEASGTRLVAVEVGAVVAGLAEITGEVQVGDEVVIPS